MIKKSDSLGDRMKHNYENRSRFYLNRRTPVIMRLDGKAFHTLTRKYCVKPFDDKFIDSMISSVYNTACDIMGAKCVYVQSDEATILITDFDKLATEAWFDYNIQKMVSIAASIMSVNFTRQFGQIGVFDCRVFNVPKEEIVNNFVWRQKDWYRNSVNMYARSFFSHKQMYKKSVADVHEMLHEEGENWAHLDDKYKNGVFMTRNILKEGEKGQPTFHVWNECPDFATDRTVIEKFIYDVED